MSAAEFHAVVPLGDTLASAVRTAIGDESALAWRERGSVLEFLTFGAGGQGIVELPCTAYAPLIATLAEEWALEATEGRANAVTVSVAKNRQCLITFEPTTIYTEE